MSKILWISDAGRPTGFGTVTHALGERLADMGHEIHVLAIGWDAAWPVEGPLKLYRAEAGRSHSYLGYDRQVEVVRKVDPDLIILNEDAPMTIRRLFDNPFDKDNVLAKAAPILSYLPIDGTNIPPRWRELTEQVKVVPYTQFGADQLGLDYWIHHGVDPVFRPLPRKEKLKTRAQMGIPEDSFVIGRVDTNSGRKDWGSTWKTIDLAYEGGLDRSRSMAVWHTKLKAPGSGVDLKTIISRGRGTYAVTNEEGWPVEDLVRLINTFDVTLNTSRGEGWGLNIAQSLACGVPVIATQCSSIPEIVGFGGTLVPGVATMTNPYGIELVLADTAEMANVLQMYADNKKLRATASHQGIEHVAQFTWEAAATQLNDIILGLAAQT